MAGATDRIVVELRRFFEPLSLAFADANQFAAFLRRFGFNLGGEAVIGAMVNLAGSRNNILAFAEACRAAIVNGLDPADIALLATAARPLFEDVRTIAQALDQIDLSSL